MNSSLSVLLNTSDLSKLKYYISTYILKYCLDPFDFNYFVFSRKNRNSSADRSISVNVGTKYLGNKSQALLPENGEHVQYVITKHTN